MEIGEKADSQVRKRGGPAGDVERLLGHLDVVPLVHEPVRGRPGSGAERYRAGGP